MSRSKRKRTGVSGLLLGLVLAAYGLLAPPQLTAQIADPPAIASQTKKDRSAPAHRSIHRVGKARERGPVQKQKEGRAGLDTPKEQAGFEPAGEVEWGDVIVERTATQSGAHDASEETGVQWFEEAQDAGDGHGELGHEPVADLFQEPRRVELEQEQEEEGAPEGKVEEGLLFRQRVSSEKFSLGLRLGRYEYPEQVLEPFWTQSLAVVEDGSISSLQAALSRLYEAKLDTGFRNIPDYATLLVRRAFRLLEAGDFLEARVLGETAYNLAPQYYPVSLSLSRLAGEDPQQGLARSFHWKWVSLKQRLNDFLWLFTTAGRTFALLLTALYLFFLFLGFYFLGRYAGVFLHFVRERLPVGPVAMTVVGTALGGTVLVLLLLPGPFWATVFLGFLSGRFVRSWEKVCFTLFLLLWAASPWLFNQTVCFFSPLSDATNAIHRCIQGDWNAAGEEALNAAVQRYPESLDLQLTLALVEKRRGEYEDAIRVLNKALLEHPQAGSLWNNLGNLHAIRGDLEEAKAAYHKAVLYGNGSAAPHYNLSQLLRREFSFLKGAQEYQRARKIDAERVDYFTYIHSPNPNRLFIDEEPGQIALWRHAFYRTPETERAADEVWRSTAAGIPLRQMPWVFLVLASGYVLVAARRKNGQEAFVCSTCGQVVCRRCDAGAEAGGLCSPCYQALYQKENISKERRHDQIRRMARYQSRRSRRLLLLNLVLPGLGFVLLEERPRGMLILFGFLFLSLVAGFWSNLLPVPMTVWETGGPSLKILSILLVVLLYGILQRRFITKIRARR